MRRLISLGAIVVLCGLFPSFALAQSSIPPDVRESEPWVPDSEEIWYAEETGHTVDGPFKEYLNNNGLNFGIAGPVTYEESLARFGYPITRVFMETFEDGSQHYVQYFERARLEYHEENEDPYKVLIGHFGREILALHPELEQAAAPAQPDIVNQCEFFQETQHNLCGELREYWEVNGGLMSFGYPISELTFQSFPDGQTLQVQYFERVRLEIHPENRGTPYLVLLGHLGDEVLTMRMNQ